MLASSLIVSVLVLLGELRDDLFATGVQELESTGVEVSLALGCFSDSFYFLGSQDLILHGLLVLLDEFLNLIFPLSNIEQRRILFAAPNNRYIHHILINQCHDLIQILEYLNIPSIIKWRVLPPLGLRYRTAF